MRREKAGCVTFRSCAAREKLPVWANATKSSSHFSSTPGLARGNGHGLGVGGHVEEMTGDEALLRCRPPLRSVVAADGEDFEPALRERTSLLRVQRIGEAGTDAGPGPCALWIDGKGGLDQ